VLNLVSAESATGCDLDRRSGAGGWTRRREQGLPSRRVLLEGLFTRNRVKGDRHDVASDLLEEVGRAIVRRQKGPQFGSQRRIVATRFYETFALASGQFDRPLEQVTEPLAACIVVHVLHGVKLAL
jgi:hypothetical protein